MIRTIIQIDEEACNGCGLCVAACHEGAIGLVAGKAKLLRDDYCDGLGDCLSACPTDAITFCEREALPYNEAAVLANMQNTSGEKEKAGSAPVPSGCPGSRAQLLDRSTEEKKDQQTSSAQESVEAPRFSELSQWPIEIKLVPVTAPYFTDASVLIAADCTAYAYANFHRDFIRGRITLIGCPKLDSVDYSEKLQEIFAHNNLASITVARMEVPCCGGLEQAVRKALAACGKDIPLEIRVISTKGELL